MDRVTIGHALGERRRLLGLDQGTAANRIGISRSTYAAYEHGGRRPSVDVLRSLAKFLDVTLDEVLELYGATCIVLARLALMRDMLTDGESGAGLSDAASEVADAAAAIVAEADAAKGAAVVEVTPRRAMRNDDMSVLKRVYFDVVTGSDHRPSRSYAVVTSDGPGAVRRVRGSDDDVANAVSGGEVVSLAVAPDRDDRGSKKKGKKKSASKGDKKRPKNKDKSKPKDDDKKRKKKKRKDRR